MQWPAYQALRALVAWQKGSPRSARPKARSPLVSQLRVESIAPGSLLKNAKIERVSKRSPHNRIFVFLLSGPHLVGGATASPRTSRSWKVTIRARDKSVEAQPRPGRELFAQPHFRI